MAKCHFSIKFDVYKYKLDDLDRFRKINSCNPEIAR